MVGAFEYSWQVRYIEVDAQGVVFNGWYLTYFDEAMSAFLESRGLPYPELLDAGFDVQLVRCETDWRAGLRWREDSVAVSTARLGRTSAAAPGAALPDSIRVEDQCCIKQRWVGNRVGGS